MTSFRTRNLVLLVDGLRAAIELAIARVRLGEMPDGAAVTLKALSPDQDGLVERVAYAIPRVAARVPWRADCLVQASAARRWLALHRIESTIHFGVPKDKQPAFEAHAWLTVGERVVTGGDISGYIPLER